MVSNLAEGLRFQAHFNQHLVLFMLVKLSLNVTYPSIYLANILLRTLAEIAGVYLVHSCVL